MFFCPFVFAQKNIGGKPYSFTNELHTKYTQRNMFAEVVLEKLDMKKLEVEDKITRSRRFVIGVLLSRASYVYLFFKQHTSKYLHERGNGTGQETRASKGKTNDFDGIKGGGL
jgi:hypothetical protein